MRSTLRTSVSSSADFTTSSRPPSAPARMPADVTAAARGSPPTRTSVDPHRERHDAAMAAAYSDIGLLSGRLEHRLRTGTGKLASKNERK
jgi:hypothetical protein